MSIAEAAEFWAAHSPKHLGLSHVREFFGEWEAHGGRVRAMILDLLGEKGDLGTIVEWGVGGGSVASALIADADRYVGVDVNELVLERARAEVPRLQTVLVPFEDPEQAEARVGLADLFVSSWCFPHFPTKSYARRVFQMAHRMTHDTGRAVLNLVVNDHKRLVRDARPYDQSFDRRCQLTTEEALDMVREAGWTPSRIKRTGPDSVAWMALTKE